MWPVLTIKEELVIRKIFESVAYPFLTYMLYKMATQSMWDAIPGFLLLLIIALGFSALNYGDWAEYPFDWIIEPVKRFIGWKK